VFETLSSQSLVLAAVKFALITKLPNCTAAIQSLLQSVNQVRDHIFMDLAFVSKHLLEHIPGR